MHSLKKCSRMAWDTFLCFNYWKKNIDWSKSYEIYLIWLSNLNSEYSLRRPWIIKLSPTTYFCMCLISDRGVSGFLKLPLSSPPLTRKEYLTRLYKYSIFFFNIESNGKNLETFFLTQSLLLCYEWQMK